MELWTPKIHMVSISIYVPISYYCIHKGKKFNSTAAIDIQNIIIMFHYLFKISHVYHSHKEPEMSMKKLQITAIMLLYINHVKDCRKTNTISYGA